MRQQYLQPSVDSIMQWHPGSDVGGALVQSGCKGQRRECGVAERNVAVHQFSILTAGRPAMCSLTIAPICGRCWRG